MWLPLLASAVAADVHVGAGESIASALSGANDGDVVYVDPAADPSGRVNLSNVAITVTSEGDGRATLPFLNLTGGVELTLREVNLTPTDLGAQVRSIIAFDSVIHAEDVELFPAPTGQPIVHVYLIGGQVDLTRVVSRDLRGWLVIAEDSAEADVTLTDCEVTGLGAPSSGSSGVAQLPGTTFRKSLTVLGGRYADNAAAYPLFVATSGGAVSIAGATFAGNTSPGSYPTVLATDGAPVALDRVRFCDNPGPGLLVLKDGLVNLHRVWIDAAGATAPPIQADAVDLTVTHGTFVGDPGVDVFGLLSGAVSLTNTLFTGFSEPASPPTTTASHTLWVGDAPGWLAGDPALVVAADAGFVDGTRGDCDAPPVPGPDSPAIDAGDPALALEDGDVGLPDIGAFPGVSDDDPLPIGGIIVGGGGCSGAAGPVWLAAVGLLVRRRR